MQKEVIAIDLGGTNLRVASLKTIKLNKVLKQKVYKLNIINKNSMLPGDPLGLPDESFILMNIQIGGVYGRDNCIY